MIYDIHKIAQENGNLFKWYQPTLTIFPRLFNHRYDRCFLTTVVGCTTVTIAQDSWAKPITGTGECLCEQIFYWSSAATDFERASVGCDEFRLNVKSRGCGNRRIEIFDAHVIIFNRESAAI